MATLLAKKSGTDDNAIAKSDDHHEAMASDITITAIPQGSAFGGPLNASATTATTGGRGRGRDCWPTQRTRARTRAWGGRGGVEEKSFRE